MFQLVPDKQYPLLIIIGTIIINNHHQPAGKGGADKTHPRFQKVPDPWITSLRHPTKETWPS